MQSAEAAEFAKLAETTYRDVNIALANQFAKHASKRGLSITEIVEASNSQPFSHIHSPGIWVGGHCIPVYPHLYLFGDPDASIVSLARTVNAGTAHLAVEGISKVLGNLKNLNALVLGVSYRPGVKESSFSGAFALNYELTIRGVKAFFRDPFYEREELISLGLRPYNESEEFEIIILHTAHEEFRNIAGELRVLPQVVLDGRNFFTKDQWTSVNYISL
jgi:nucleotide sugar dehydrogenase